MEEGHLLSHVVDLIVFDDAWQLVTTLHLLVQRHPRITAIVGIRTTVSLQYIGQEMFVAGTGQEYVKAVQPIVIFSEQIVRPVRRHLGHHRRTVVEHQPIHPVCAHIGAYLHDGTEPTGVSVVGPCVAQDLVVAVSPTHGSALVTAEWPGPR